jgi:outer membrane protein OmpA-like peptidoglycan-associated protein
MPISFSFKEPVLLGRDAASRAMNRRVEISYQI